LEQKGTPQPPRACSGEHAHRERVLIDRPSVIDGLALLK
jgi:hypothetical protein